MLQNLKPQFHIESSNSKIGNVVNHVGVPFFINLFLLKVGVVCSIRERNIVILATIAGCLQFTLHIFVGSLILN